MPAIDLLIAFLLGIGITIVVVFMALYYNIEKKKLDIEKVKIRDKRKSGPF
jgi:capsular polysaccharide biosynthesis protein